MFGQAAKLPPFEEGDEVIVTKRGVKPWFYQHLVEFAGGEPVRAQVYTLRDGSPDCSVRLRDKKGKYAKVSPQYVPVAALQHVPEALARKKAHAAQVRAFAKPGAAESWWGAPSNTLISRGQLQHPSGLILRVGRLGAGHATTAHLGEDGWVYLFTKDDARDPAKKVLHNARKHIPKGARWGKHLPQIEEVGAGSTDRKSGHVWRTPKYEKPTGETAALGRRLNKMITDAYHQTFKPGVLSSSRSRRGMNEVDYRRTPKAVELFFEQLQLEVRAGKVPRTVEQALQHLYEATTNFSETWMFEFPPRNLMQDDKGNLILLDVIFDREALKRLRGL